MADNQNPNGVPVQRYFEYMNDSIHMYSKLQVDFGEVILHGVVSFFPTFLRDQDGKDQTFLTIHQEVENSFDENVPLEMRVGEMNYLLSISLLFNPKNKTEYGIPKESETSDL